jgi:DNA-binding winged helix-turn-helix (wHTH) protein
MGTESPSKFVYRFRSFALDLSTNELRRSGIRLKLHGQPIAILKMLLEHPGEVISREALRHALWSDNTFVEFEHGLNNNINRLRTALGDHAGTPRFIETVPGLGYRFISTVNCIPSAMPERERIRVAVIPFTCIGGAVDGFAQAVTSHTIVQLAESASCMNIISPTCWSSRRNRTAEIDFIVTGAIWRNPPASRVSLQLVRGSDSCCTWGATYTFSDPDLFSVLKQMAADVSLNCCPRQRELDCAEGCCFLRSRRLRT